jgi:enamine deaminase RidA (YjgF/YER057c/UK114 family)/quinol monooxygenase YgiN
MISYFNPSDLPPSPYYSHSAALNSGRLVFVSGQAPLDATGKLVGRGDVRQQAEQVFANLRRALQAAGADVADLLNIETYYLNRADLPVYAEVRRAFFAEREHPPISTTVQVAGLVTEGALLEISAVAVVPARAEVTDFVINVVATVQARTGMADILEKELLANAARTRREPGCLKYDLHRSLDDPHLFALYEIWRSRAALAAHFEMPYMKALAARRAELIEQSQIHVLQRLA